MSHPGQSLPTIDLVDLHGHPTSLQDHLGPRPAVVLAMRYYGCLPCQHYLVDLHARREALTDRGVDLVVVGVAADFQAQYLGETYGIDSPMLLDPDQNLYRALAIPRLRPVDFLRPSTWRIYLPLFWHRHVTRRVDGPRQGRIVGDPAQLPGSPSSTPTAACSGSTVGRAWATTRPSTTCWHASTSWGWRRRPPETRPGAPVRPRRAP